MVPVPRNLERGAVAERSAAQGARVRWSALGSSHILLPAPPPPTFHNATRDELRQAWVTAEAQRNEWLLDFHKAPAALPQSPKDLSVRPRYFYMRCNDMVTARCVSQMAQIGRREGFMVVVESRNINGHAIARGARANLAVLQTSTLGSPWCEDDGGFNSKGGVSVPAYIGNLAFMDEAVNNDRAHRLMGLPSFPLSCGNVEKFHLQMQKVALAVAGGRDLRVNLSCVEGGNILLGVLPNGERYALVGRDSLATTRAHLTRDSGRQCTYHGAKQAVALDYGVPVKNVVAVEQPGVFHLDRAMVLMAPGQVLLNDARAAAELEIRWMRQDLYRLKPQGNNADALANWQTMYRTARKNSAEFRRAAKQDAAYEARACDDLRAKGLQVMRVAGRFDRWLKPANFLNGEGGTNALNQRYFVTQGGDPRAEAYIADLYLRRIPTGLKRLYFLDASASAATVMSNGGVGCLATVEGDIV